MKAKILSTSFLFVMGSSISVGLAGGPSKAEPARERTFEPTVERIMPGSSDGPIIVRRTVYRNESLPELGARLYDKVDYELKLRQLARDIRVVETELELQRERLKIYDKEFGYTHALLVTRQNARLAVVRSEEQLKLLRQAKLLALRQRNDQVLYRKLLLAEGAARLQLGD